MCAGDSHPSIAGIPLYVPREAASGIEKGDRDHEA
jgi:hypothetical protein